MADHPRSTPERYRERNTVERGFGRFKQWRGIATRYDKYRRPLIDGVTSTLAPNRPTS